MKSILVQVDTSRASRNRVVLALRLAQAFDAHLTGLHITPTYAVPMYAEAPVGPDIIEAVRQAGRENAAQSKRLFDETNVDHGVETSWRAVEDDIVDALCRHARASDLAVLGQFDPEDPADASPGIVEHFLLEAGRPCLIVPYIDEQYELTGTVLVAWSGSRESARAVKDALPIMAKARQVELLRINPAEGANGDGAEDLRAYLARHGIDAKIGRIHNSDIPTGDILLSHAADVSADLIVAGAYGHTRLREKILGGVTRHLLEHMTVPVLMSH